jgi:addiction module HigA family antidote
MPMKNPPHPGDFIRTEIIEPAGLSVTAAATALRVSRPALSSLLNGKADLSGEMALRIEKAFGVKMDTLMRMQASYDIAQIRKREREIRVRRFDPPAEARHQGGRAASVRKDPSLDTTAVRLPYSRRDLGTVSRVR